MHNISQMLSEKDFENTAKILGIEIAVIKAVAEVESKGNGFLDSGEPKILFERHIFSKLTEGKYDRTNPNISNKKSGGYGLEKNQHSRLQEAVKLDKVAALQSASWGRFQIMGFNWKDLGYKSIQEFINAMYRSEASQLDAFARYILVNNLVDVLRQHKWKEFARRYNGPEYRKNKYDIKLAAAYRKYK